MLAPVTLPTAAQIQHERKKKNRGDAYQSLDLDLFDRGVQSAAGRGHGGAGSSSRLFTGSHDELHAEKGRQLWVTDASAKDASWSVQKQRRIVSSSPP